MRFLLIDRIVDFQPGARITAVKSLTMAEEYLADHFPNFPVMPGVLMLEAMTQAAAWLIRLSEDFAHSMILLKQAANVKYGQFVEPGQLLTVTAEIISQTATETKVKAQGTVDGRTTVSGRLVLERYNLADRNPLEAIADELILQEMRNLLTVLYQPGPPGGAIDRLKQIVKFMRLEGKTAIVTGGSRGIGRACVARLAAEGATVAFLYNPPRRPPRPWPPSCPPRAARSAPCRPTSATPKRAQEIVDSLVNEWQRIDILVNSAGITKDGLTGSMTDEQWRDVIDTNLAGTFNYCHAVSQPMLMARSGSIVNLSSTAAEFASRGQVNYAASKGGINGLTRALAKELAARKVRVNAVAPGMIETDMSQVVRGIAGDQIKTMIPLKRIGKPEEIAAVVAFLASDDASYLTGQVLRVDGGLSLGGY